MCTVKNRAIAAAWLHAALHIEGLKPLAGTEPLYDPGLYFAHECPDLFKMGDWWYLLFSEFSEATKTRYRMARSLQGPWIAPRQDTFDGRAFYAAKTTTDRHRRFLFGWNPTRTENKDDGSWNWGGNLVIHEIHQEQDGSLAVLIPENVNKSFGNPLSFDETLHAPGSYAWKLAEGMPVGV